MLIGNDGNTMRQRTLFVNKHYKNKVPKGRGFITCRQTLSKRKVSMTLIKRHFRLIR